MERRELLGATAALGVGLLTAQTLGQEKRERSAATNKDRAFSFDKDNPKDVKGYLVGTGTVNAVGISFKINMRARSVKTKTLYQAHATVAPSNVGTSWYAMLNLNSGDEYEVWAEFISDRDHAILETATTVVKIVGS